MTAVLARRLQNQCLVHPRLECEGFPESALLRLPTNVAMDLALEVVGHIYNMPWKGQGDMMKLSDDEFNWIVACTGFCLRIERSSGIDPTPMAMVLKIYCNWINHLRDTYKEAKDREDGMIKQITKREEQRLKVITLQLSQVFLNDAFDEERSQNCSNCFTDVKLMFQQGFIKSRDLWSVVVHVLLCGLSPVKAMPVFPKKMGDVVMDLMLSDMFSKEAVEQFVPVLNEALSGPDVRCTDDGVMIEGFVVSWINRFLMKYREALSSRMGLETQDAPAIIEEKLQFLRRLIDEALGRDQKHMAFTRVVGVWLQWSRSSQQAVFKTIPTDAIKEEFWSWFAIDGTWRKEDNYVWHPLFVLLAIGEKESQPTLREVAREYVVRVINQGRDSENDAYWYLPVYALEFLYQESDLMKEYKKKFLEWHKRCRNRKHANKQLIFQSMLMLYVRLYRILDPNDEVRESILDILCEDSEDLVIQFSCIMGLYACGELVRFWRRLNEILLDIDEEDTWRFFALFAVFVPAISKSALASLHLDKGIWERMNKMKDVELRLLMLLMISENARFFDTSPELVPLVQQGLSDQEKDVLHEMLHLSLTSGSVRATPEKLKSAFSPEMYATSRFIITVDGDHGLIIRHGLGATVYDVGETGTGQLYQTPADICMDKVSAAPTPASTYEYVSQCEIEDSVMSYIKDVESQLGFSESKYQKYQEPAPQESLSKGHTLLCDIGFLNPSCWNHVHVINEGALRQDIEKIDSISPWPEFRMYVVQLLRSDNGSKLDSQETFILRRVMQDLDGISNCGVCRFDLRVPVRVGVAAEYAATSASEASMLIVVNESRYVFRGPLQEWKSPIVLCVTPFDDKTYMVHIVFHDFPWVVANGTSSFKAYVARENLSVLVAMLGFLFNFCPEKSQHDGRGPVLFKDFFKAQFYQRISEIRKIYSMGTQGMLDIFTACTKFGGVKQQNEEKV